MKIVRLARLAYSGRIELARVERPPGQAIRRSIVLPVLSIHHHELPAQDRNRIAILRLSAFPTDQRQLAASFLVPAAGARMGHQLRRRLIEQWPRFDATLAVYQAEMLRQGYSGREQDTYGTLLACGDMMLYDDEPFVQTGSRAYQKVRELASIIDASRNEAIDLTERCLRHLASHRLPAKGGESQETVARWVQKLIVQIVAKNTEARDTTKLRLGAHGLRVVNLQKDHEKGQGGMVDAYVAMQENGEPFPMWLAVANKTNRGTQEIFANSSWQGGVWTQSLSLVEESFHNKKARFGGGSPEGCVLVPLTALVDVEDAIREGRAHLG
jgi:hypothetical protein